MRYFLLLTALLLAACASQAPLPARAPTLALPQNLHVQRHQHGQSQDWILVIQQEGPALRWTLMDPMGIPQARQILDQGQWHADGLLPPNPQARELFAALLFALTPDAELLGTYPTATAQPGLRRLGERWEVRSPHSGSYELKLEDGLRYQVESLPSEQDQ